MLDYFFSWYNFILEGGYIFDYYNKRKKDKKFF